jgi:hypothetical protein
MGLAAFQAALARLLADPRARDAWRRDPEKFARACGLSPTESATLAALPDDGVAAYAASLGRKAANAKHR